ncbi:Acyl-CoA dehydrogenase [Sulfidibacter corallicola]|uniref:3-methylmercaptopropionyl-CoA dehydrogenase n=1 Tax=Sulfidibacter corallicola TaxID=2818388 RepID=A0A8A4TQ84_SULCO|nr:acyl-CoA dehydrogenase [Sulfidibacter corallicola]QTD52129.1 acyl-CoA dehydrogenase [Sulfidibacter corallicola]
MTHYQINERDMMFNLKECPGLQALADTDGYEDTSEETLDLIFEQAKKFATEVLAEHFVVGDRQGCELVDGEVKLPEGFDNVWEQYAETGMVGINADAEFGGANLPHFFSSPVAEMECGSNVSFSMLPLLTRGAARLIYTFGTQELKEKYLENMYSGEWSGTMCLTEPGAGSDVGAGLTKAVPEGDHFKISGTKIFITWGDHELTKNIVHLVLARTPDAPPGSKGLSLFVVPKYLTDDEGNVIRSNDVTCGNIEHKMGIKASPTCVINFGTDDDCIGWLIGEPNKGMSQMFQMMNDARLEVGIQGMAQASAAYLSALGYAKERAQGSIRTAEGARPAKIIEHPDVRRMLLRMRAIVEASRAMIYHMSLYMDLAHHGKGDRERYRALSELLTPVVKSYGSDQGFRVTEMAIQTYGGYGFCQEYPVEQYMRDIKIASIYEGTNGIQALDLVFRKILMNKGAHLKVWLGDVAALCGELKGTRLEAQADALGKAAQTAAAVATKFGEWAATGKAEAVQYRATDFQEHLGHVMGGYFLLRQAQYAAKCLEGQPSPADQHFYEQKIVTTDYFIGDQVVQSVSALQHLMQVPFPGTDVSFD